MLRSIKKKRRKSDGECPKKLSSRLEGERGISRVKVVIKKKKTRLKKHVSSSYFLS
jgi:hypothetical protein